MSTDIEPQAGGNLAVRADQAFWTDEQRAVLAQAGVDKDATNAELAAFLHVCQRRKLDPFTRQIYLIGRWDKRASRKVYTIQTSIDGFRLIARRAADASGIDYEYEDTVWFGPDGSRHEVWLSDQPPAAAKVVVIRNGRRYDAVARYSAYAQTDKDGKPTGQWRTMPDTMTAKCAEALALRKAFPEDLGGLYTSDEMGQADNPDRAMHVVQGKAERPEPPKPPQASTQEQGDALVSKALLMRLGAQFTTLGVTDRDEGLMTIALLTGIKVTNTRELTNAQAQQLINVLDPLTKADDPSAALTGAIETAIEAMRAEQAGDVLDGQIVTNHEEHDAAA